MEEPHVTRTVTRKIPLEFIHIKNPIEGVKKKLDETLNVWNESLQGVMESYSKVAIKDNKARILDEYGYLLVTVEYKGEYFIPKIGQKMKGKVTTISPDQIALLVDGVFNAVIPKENVGPWKYKEENWKLGGRNLEQNDEIKFVVQKIEVQSEYMLIVGQIPVEAEEPKKKPRHR